MQAEAAQANASGIVGVTVEVKNHVGRARDRVPDHRHRGPAARRRAQAARHHPQAHLHPRPGPVISGGDPFGRLEASMVFVGIHSLIRAIGPDWQMAPSVGWGSRCSSSRHSARRTGEGYRRRCAEAEGSRAEICYGRRVSLIYSSRQYGVECFDILRRPRGRGFLPSRVGIPVSPAAAPGLPRPVLRCLRRHRPPARRQECSSRR